MKLTNKQRRCMGMREIQPSWECKKIDSGWFPSYAYIDEEDIIRKMIKITDRSYIEEDFFLQSIENRTKYIHKLDKSSKHTYESALSYRSMDTVRYESNGNYFQYAQGEILIGNATSHRVYYSSVMAGIPPMSSEEVVEFLGRWVQETDEEKQKEIEAFAAAKEEHFQYQEGDFFRFCVDRTHYGYGRILLDVMKMREEGKKFWDILAGKPLIVQVYHILTEDPNVPIAELEQLPACPAQYILDDHFYYGNYEIIGNAPISGEPDYPILYGRGMRDFDSYKLIMQRGPVYREVLLEDDDEMTEEFWNNYIGCTLDIDKNVLAACVEQNSNAPYWRDEYFFESDLRNPKNAKKLQKILARMERGERAEERKKLEKVQRQKEEERREEILRKERNQEEKAKKESVKDAKREGIFSTIFKRKE